VNDDALAREVEDKFIRAFVRTSKPATTECREKLILGIAPGVTAIYKYLGRSGEG
jgi:hypothetical protein